MVEANRCIPMPDAMPFDEASAFILTYGTSYHALKQRAAIKPGETMLVLGAAGGVGLAACELGKAMGARVVAACSTQEKVDLCLKHGAESGVVYPTGEGGFDKDGKKALADLFKGLRAARAASTWSTTRWAATTPRRRCGPRRGRGGSWWWASRRASRRSR